MTRRFQAHQPDPYRTARRLAKAVVIVVLVGLVLVAMTAVPDAELVSRGLG